MNAALQAKYHRPVWGARGGQDVRLEATRAHSVIQAMRKQDTGREGARFSISFLAWGPLSTWSPSIREVESIKRKATPSLFYLPKGTLSFSLLFYASLCSHHLFSLKGSTTAQRKFSPRMSFPERSSQTRVVCAALCAAWRMGHVFSRRGLAQSWPP